jgi:hypothetical protein
MELKMNGTDMKSGWTTSIKTLVEALHCNAPTAVN